MFLISIRHESCLGGCDTMLDEILEIGERLKKLAPTGLLDAHLCASSH